MSLESVRAFLAEKAPDIVVIELERSSATVALAAEGHGVAPGQIAKTLSFAWASETSWWLPVAMRGSTIKKPRPHSAAKRVCLAPMKSWMSPDTRSAVSARSGFQAGLPSIAMSRSKSFSEVVPARGFNHSAARIDPLRMAELIGAAWVDVCQDNSEDMK